MKKYMLLYKGPATPPNASHEGWPEWFSGIGNALVTQGSPMTGQASLRRNGSSEDVTNLNGYSIIQAEDMDKALMLVRGHPYLKQPGDDYAIEIFEVPKL